MRKLTLLLASIFAFMSQSKAHGHGYTTINSYADAFVFDEMGVTFSVYPDGEFDFYLGDACESTTVSNGYVNVTFNSGYDYNPYVQYDDFGAVIQVENVPVWYDYYGRVSQIGDVMINYRNRRVCQVGGLYVHYNRHGHYAYHTGFINTWNPYFVYRPFYVAFARPVINMCFVRTTPYRQYYRPVRYTYYRPYVANVRPCYATIGHTYRPAGYGHTHGRYTQSAGRGEIAFKRERRTVTTASARLNPSNRGTISSNRKPTTAAYSRNTNAAKPAVSGNTSRKVGTSNTRNVKPSSGSNRSVVGSKPRQVQTAPTQTRTSSSLNTKPAGTNRLSSTSNRATKPNGNTVSRGNVRMSSTTRTVTKPTTSRTQTSTKPTVQRSSSNRSGGRTVSKAPTTSRSSGSATRSTSRSGSANSAKGTTRTMSKGSSTTTASKRGK